MKNEISTAVAANQQADLVQLEDALRGIIADAAESLLDGVREDLELFAATLQQQLAHGLATGNKTIVDSVHRQVRLLGEQQRIEASDAAWEVFQRVIGQLGAVLIYAGDIALAKAFGAARSIR